MLAACKMAEGSAFYGFRTGRLAMSIFSSEMEAVIGFQRNDYTHVNKYELQKLW